MPAVADEPDVVVEPDEPQRLFLGEVEVDEGEGQGREHRAEVKSTNPTSHGEMKAKAHSASRRASADSRGRRGRERAVIASSPHRLGLTMRPTGSQAVPGSLVATGYCLSQIACIWVRRSSISVSRSRPFVACHFVPKVMSRSSDSL